MAAFERFLGATSRHKYLGRESQHATGAKHRLDDELAERFGSATNAMDEIVIEWTSSFVMADLGIANAPCAEHTTYLASRLDVLNGDPRAIFAAASEARAAADWMHAQQHVPVEYVACATRHREGRATSSYHNASPRKSMAAPFPSTSGKGRMLR